MIEKLSKDKYRYRIYINGKQYNSKSYKTKKEAQEAEAIALLNKDNPIKKSFHIVALSYFEDLRLSKKESTIHSYIQTYNNHLKPYFGNKNLSSINVLNIKEWHDIMLKKGYSVDYLNKVNSNLVSILNYGMKNYGLNKNVAQVYGRFEKPPEIKENKIRYITLEDFNKFISVINDDLDKTFFITGFYTGCRKSELFSLKWSEVDFNNNIITIATTLSKALDSGYKITTTKTNKTRKIQMSNTLREQLLKWYNICKSYKDFSNNWFVFGGTRYLSRTTMDRKKHQYFIDSGVKEVTMHELFRHSNVSLLVNQYLKTGNTDTTKFFLLMSERLGHSVEVMQRTYLHLFPSAQNEIVELLNNL